MRLTLAIAMIVFPLAFAPQPAHATSWSKPVTLIDVRFLSARSGWGLSAHAVLRTTDGGRRWTAVRVPAQPNSFFDVAFTTWDENTAWLVPPLQVQQGAPRSVVLSTIDGGRHWRKSNSIRGWAFGASSFSWVTAQRGWLLTGEGGAAGSTPTSVYRTTDGGLQWWLVAYNHLLTGSPRGLGSCDGYTGISFRTSKLGWAAGSCGAAPQVLMLYRTSDGGSTWQQQHLSSPERARYPGWSLDPPVFSGTTGVLPAEVWPCNCLVLYLSHNGGLTWSPTKPIADHDLTSPDVFALDPLHVWTWIGNTLYGTSDAGQHWRLLSHRLSLSGQVRLDFVNSRVGFALGGYSGREQLHLLATNDGGRTWHRLATTAVARASPQR